MKKSLIKNTFREIGNTKARFFSIMAIIALGVGFMAGVKSTSPSMLQMAEKYYSNNSLMDFRLISPVGFSKSDIEKVEDNSETTSVMPSYFVDAIATENDRDEVIHIMSLPKSYNGNSPLNTPDVIEGRLPKNTEEIALDEHDFQDMEIGDFLEFNKKSGDNLTKDSIKNLKYKVVGKVRSPMYISFERGNSSIGDGNVNGVAFLKEECFKSKKYTELYVKTKASNENISPYSDNYSEKIDKEEKDYKKIGEDAVDAFVTKKQNDIDKEQKKLDDKRKKSENELKKQRDSIDSAQKELDSGKQLAVLAGMDTSSLDLQQKEIDRNLDKLESAQGKADKKLDKGQKKLDKAQKDIDKLKGEGWYINTRDDNPGYSSFKENTDRVDNVATVFPVFFLLVAILVCVTTMTRLVDEKRTEMGTLKALGYSDSAITCKYLVYACLSGLFGCIFGLIIAVPVLPRVIYNAYKMMYFMPEIDIVPATGAIVVSVITALLCTILVAYFTCKRTLKVTSASLMRPKAPKAGSRILLERIKFIWKRLSFTSKVTARNLFRYKARFMMTVIGVAGCTALVMAAFYLHDSINGVADRQFNEMYHYNASVVNNTEGTEKQLKSLTYYIDSDKDVEDSMLYLYKAISAKYNKNSVNSSVYLTVPENSQKLSDLVDLRVRGSHKEYTLNNNEVIISEKLGKLLNISTGDSITLKYENKNKEFKVGGIIEQYVYHTVYMSPELYKKSYGEKPKFNMTMLDIPDLTEDMEKEIGSRYIKNDDVTAITFNTSIMRNFSKTMRSLDMVVFVMIFCAGLLAFIVLYNLTNINIAERLREIATIKVLGFYDRETSAYIYRENIVLTLLGIVFGLALGILLGYFIIVTVEIENVMFSREINILSFLWSILITAVFAFVVNFIMHFRMKKIDMVESLKSIE